MQIAGLSLDGALTFHDSVGPARVLLAVAEPAALVLFAAGLLLLLAVRRARQNAWARTTGTATDSGQVAQMPARHS
jgi:hypothetical protein